MKSTRDNPQYVFVWDPTHPLAPRNGMVYEHRRVLYAEIGPGNHACHWCGQQVAWHKGDGLPRLVVDHLDENHANNDPANLVPSCSGCNANRQNMNRTHCKHGHELTPDVLIINKNGSTACRTCYRAYHRRRWAEGKTTKQRAKAAQSA